MYVYLSDGKLRSMIPRDPRWWSRMRARRVQAGLAAAGAKIAVDLETTALLRLGAEINKAEWDAGTTGKWYEDDSLEVGDWMFYEGRIGCHVVDLEPAPGAVLFCQVRSAGDRAVLLHGSAKHLVGRAPASEPPGAPSSPFSDPSAFPDIVQQASPIENEPLWRFWRQFGRRNLRDPDDALQAALAGLYARVVDTAWFRASAPNLAGCALVSAIMPAPDGGEFLIGSPLFVRRSRPGS